MENTWLEYLAKRILEDSNVPPDQLDQNDPTVKAIMRNPRILTSFSANPGAPKNQIEAQKIVNKAKATDKPLPVVAAAANIAKKAGMMRTGNNV